MTRKIKALEPHDRVMGIDPLDPLLSGRRFYKGIVVRCTEHGVIIRSDDPEDPPDGDLYGFDDRRLARAIRLKPRQLGEPPWLDKDKREVKSRRRTRKRPRRRASSGDPPFNLKTRDSCEL